MNVAKRISRLTRLIRRLRFGETWEPHGDGFIRRKYSDYSSYLAHQRSKLRLLDLSRYDVEYRAVLSERLRSLEFLGRGTTVLCLAARLGTEVKAFLDVGCFAVGLDLNPGKWNRFVVQGDFHHIQFADASVEVIFTNSLDHSFDVQALLAEVRRILKPGGRVIIEAVVGTRLGKDPHFYESFWWSEVGDLVRLFEQHGFALIRRDLIQVPWHGEQLVFEPVPSPS